METTAPKQVILYTTAGKRHDERGTRTLGTVGLTDFGEAVRQVELPLSAMADQKETYNNRGVDCWTEDAFAAAVAEGKIKTFA